MYSYVAPYIALNFKGGKNHGMFEMLHTYKFYCYSSYNTKFHACVHAHIQMYIQCPNNQYYYNLVNALSASKSFYIDKCILLKRMVTLNYKLHLFTYFACTYLYM